MKHLKKHFGLLVIIGGYLLATLINLNSASIWFDEAFSRHIIRFDFAKIWYFTSVDVHPPLYYFLLKIWTSVFGASDFAIRSMSVMFGALAIAALYFLLKRLFNKKIAFFATLAAAFSPLFIRYSQEARMYMLVAFLAILAIRAFYEAFVASDIKKQKQTLWCRAYIAIICVGMWTQYLFALTVLGLWIFRVVEIYQSSKPKDRKFKKLAAKYFGEKWLSSHLWAAGFFLPWIPFFVTQAIQVKSGFWIPPVNFHTVPNFFTQLFLARDGGMVSGWYSILIYGLLIFTVWAAIKNARAGKFKKPLSMLVLTSVGAIAILYLASLPPFSSIFVNRYLIASLIVINALIAILIYLTFNDKKHRRVAILAAVTLVSLQLTGIVNVYETKAGDNITRQVIEQAKYEMKAGEPIITEANDKNGWIFYEAVQYSTNENPVYFLDSSADYHIGSMRMLEDDDTFKIKDLAEFSRQHETVWLLARPKDKKQKPLLKSWQLEKEILIDGPVSSKPLYSMQKYSVKSNLK